MTEKERYEKRLYNYFNQFMNENIAGSKIKIQPKRNDVPKIKQMGYSKEDDLFEFVFEYSPQEKIKKRNVKNVTFIEDENGSLVGVHITDVKKIGINQIKVILNTDLETKINEIDISLSRGEGNLSVNLIEKRKKKYLKDIISNDLEKISNKNT